MSTSSSSAASTSHSFNKILNQFRTSSKSRHVGDVDDGVKKLRRLILVEGIPSAVVIFLSKECASYQLTLTSILHQDPTLRPQIWKILLRVQELPVETFLQYVSRGPCEVREKIRNDTFRYARLHTDISMSHSKYITSVP